MTFWKPVVLSSILFAAFSFVGPAHSQVAVGVNVGVAPSVHMDISITRRTTVLRMGTTGRIGSLMAYLLV